MYRSRTYFGLCGGPGILLAPSQPPKLNCASRPQEHMCYEWVRMLQHDKPANTALVLVEARVQINPPEKGAVR